MIGRVLIFFLTGLRPLLGPATCRYPEETCGVYACNQLASQPLLRALIAIFKRVVSCNPLKR